jgi:hypothetical protein
MKVVVKNIISSPFAAYLNEGLKIYELLEKEIDSNKPVELSFKGVESCSTMFLNSSVGKLYLNFPEKKIKSLLTYSGTEGLPTFSRKIKDVVANALDSDFHDKLVSSAIFA